jgi:hypothetical protein
LLLKLWVGLQLLDPHGGTGAGADRVDRAREWDRYGIARGHGHARTDGVVLAR